MKQELPAAIYGDGGRAGRPAEGTPATVAHLAPEDIAGFHWEQVRPAAATIVIAGDLDGLDAAALASEAFTTWKDDRPASRWTPAPEPFPRLQAAAVLVNQPGAVQTQLLLAAPVPGRGQPGWNELQVAAHILGAPITGHLDARLREDAGHSYGLRAGLTELVPGAPGCCWSAVPSPPTPPSARSATSRTSSPARSATPSIPASTAPPPRR